MTHSTIAALLYLDWSERTPKAIARPSSTKMKQSFIQKEARRMRCSRKWMPRRWYSAQMKMAEMM